MGCDVASCTCKDVQNEVITTVGTTAPEWHACLKQPVRCVIETPGGFRYIATNSCHVKDAEVCPRVTAGAKTGEGYELCGPPKHAEEEAVKLFLEDFPDGEAPAGTIAYLYGHYYMCDACQVSLTDVGIRHHVITGEPA